MDNKTREMILQKAEEEDVEFIRLQFTDMSGILKNIAITAGQLPRALDNKCTIDVSLVEGMKDADAGDMYLYPDPDTFTILPWRPQQGKVARLLCDVYRPDGSVFSESSRYILKRSLRKAHKEGYDFFADPECEFFLFHTDENGLPTTTTHEKAGYLDISPLDLGENSRRDMVLTLEEMGFEIESSHHEGAPAQHEIDFREAEGLKAADQIVTFRTTVRAIAKRHGLHATFMPKPKQNVPGSGMHIHVKLRKNGRNVFFDPDKEEGISEEAYWFAGGLLKHARGMMVVTNPLINSYKRLVEGFEAPVQASWSTRRRNTMVFLSARQEETQIEIRLPDPSANPYLALAVILEAGLEGIQEQIDPDEVILRTGRELPENLKEAIGEARRDPLIHTVLGEKFYQEYIERKQTEWNTYIRQVTDWEVEQYLYRI